MTTMLLDSQAKPRISTEVRQRLVGQLTREHGISISDADHIITDTISFLTVCAAIPEGRFRPSKRVDLGWHQFILNTQDYAEFCDRVAGGFLHHVPDEFTSPAADRRATADTLAPTVEAIRAAGLPFHADLWTAESASCSQCHGGCTNCGQGEDPRCR